MARYLGVDDAAGLGVVVSDSIAKCVKHTHTHTHTLGRRVSQSVTPLAFLSKRVIQYSVLSRNPSRSVSLSLTQFLPCSPLPSLLLIHCLTD